MADWTANPDLGATGGVGALRAAGPAPNPARLAATRYASAGSGLGFTGAGAALAEFNARTGTPLDKARLALWAAGGVASLALVAGIGAWGYKVVLREMFGPPVVAAEEGPMRLVPAEPGGEVAPNQGLAVNAIPAAGEAAPPSDVLRLAPPGPGLAPEDMEVVQTTAEDGEVMPADAAGPLDVTGVTATAAVIAPEGAAQPLDRPMTAEEVIAFADRIAAGVQPLAPLDPAAAAAVVPPAPAGTATEAVAAVATATVAVIPASVPGVATAIRPPPRPALTLAAAPAVAAPAEAPAAEAAAQTVALTADLPEGTNLVQLGAFDSPEIAASEWERLSGVFGEFLQGHDRVIQEAESGGRTFYRLRATGFEDLADARRLCAALVAEEAQCIPVVVR